ncbi:protein-L-isoaspartate(D-aspartate) O-methyltransferase [bacterium]|nr:protein-L-isoaspartate(D-aspartate) O-methyltransferase [bacterium]
MLEEDLMGRGIYDKKVLEAFAKVPREEFVPPEYKHLAYEDYPLPIGAGQTISQPYMVAIMLQEMHLKGDEKVLEVGAGSGYVVALLAQICREVWGIERIESLAIQAQERLRKLGYTNAHIVVGDGTKGLPSEAPFDAILVSAAAKKVPQALLEQLAEGGRLVIPLESNYVQILTIIEKKKGKFIEREAGPCIFVPLIEE